MALLMPATVCIACTVCETARNTQATVRGNARLPNGWKRFKDDIYCTKCWRDRFVLRAIVLPIHKPLESDWTYLKDALRRCWKESTALANWAINEFAKADVVRTSQLERLPTMSRVNLYQEARAQFPQLNCQSVNAILRYAEKNYRRLRFKVVWLNEASLPVYRYPAPFPVSNQAWKASFDAEGKPDAAHAFALVCALRREGFLTSVDGAFNNCVKIRPPLVLPREDAMAFLDAFDRVIASA